MCGICGFVQSEYRKISCEVLKKMSDTLTHRGPNDEGFYINGSVGLAQRRLSIIDLSPLGHQPMSDLNEHIWVVFNGEIYNFIEIRKELNKRGHKFKSNCDTEVIIYAYLEWGKDCFSRFNGMFAIAIWDNREDELVLARDRLGKKPLYYFHRDDKFSFGSELKAIMEYPYFSKELDFQSIYYYLTFQYIPAPFTIFNNTCKLLPGHYAVFKNGNFKISKYWDVLEKKKEETSNISFNECLDEIEELFKSSLKYRLISDVPLGAFLSGGVDSALIVALMTQVSNKVKTFTIGFEQEEYNEAGYAKKIAEYFGTEHTELYISQKDMLDVVPVLPQIFDEPFADSSAIPAYLVSKMAKENVTVSLSGDGGDELFCGYNTYEYMNTAKIALLIPSFLRKSFGALIPNYSNQRLLKYREMILSENLSEMYLNLIRHWSSEQLDKLFEKKYARESLKYIDSFKSKQGYTGIDSLMLKDIKSYMVDDILVKVDRASMAVSLETRAPFLDYRLVEYAINIPLQYKYLNGERKYILKKLLSKYLPESYYNRPKKGFGIPLAAWLRGELKPLVNEYLDDKRILNQGIFNDKMIRELKDAHLSGKADYKNQLWSLLVFQMWYERYM